MMDSRAIAFSILMLMAASTVPLLGQEIFRPDSERAELAQMSAYEEFIQSEGIPIYRGQAIPSLYDLELKPWQRMGGQGAYVVA